MTWYDLICALRAKWIGQPYEYQGKTYHIVDIDPNASVMIDLPNRYTQTTAVALATLHDIIPATEP